MTDRFYKKKKSNFYIQYNKLDIKLLNYLICINNTKFVGLFKIIVVTMPHLPHPQKPSLFFNNMHYTINFIEVHARKDIEKRLCGKES